METGQGWYRMFVFADGQPQLEQTGLEELNSEMVVFDQFIHRLAEQCSIRCFVKIDRGKPRGGPFSWRHMF